MRLRERSAAVHCLPTLLSWRPMARITSVEESGKSRARGKGSQHGKLVVAEDEETESVSSSADDATEYTEDGSSVTDSGVTASTDDEDEDDEESEDDEEDEEEEDDDEDDEDDEDEDSDEDDKDESADSGASDASTRTTTRNVSALSEELSSASIRERRVKAASDPSTEALDLEQAKEIVAAAPPQEPLPPSVGATSLIEPDSLIRNPFSEPVLRDDEGAESQPRKSVTHDSRYATLGAAQIAASAKAELMNDSDYDLILARMTTQNRRLNQDPRAVRKSALGIGKLRTSFDRLQQRKHAKSEVEAEGLGPGSSDFGVGRALDGRDLNVGDNEASAEHIDWEFWGNLIKGEPT